jgi:hypothetical protein
MKWSFTTSDTARDGGRGKESSAGAIAQPERGARISPRVRAEPVIGGAIAGAACVNLAAMRRPVGAAQW